MSGPAIHHVVAEDFLRNVLKPRYNDPASAVFWNKMSGPGMEPVYLLGAQGPDILFFNVNDWPLGGVAKTAAQTYWEVQEFIDELVEKVKAMVPPAVWQAIDTLEGLAEDAVERSAVLSEISQLVGDAQKNVDAIIALIEAKLEEFVTDSVDVFSLLKHPQQHGQPYKEWWWFDTMHIRRTGQYIRALFNESKHGSPERAYALGYLTHYASDAVGHPFVNIISGGPYRTHSQRHKVVENHQDTWALNGYLSEDLPTSNLARNYVVNGNSKELPPDLKKFILKCIERVYYKNGAPLYGRKIGPDDLDVSYRMWLAWFTKSTNDLGLPLPQPYSITAEIAEAWDKFVNNVGDIANYVGNSMSGGGGLLGFLKALAALILGGALLGAAVLDFLAGEVTTLAAAPIRFFLSLSYEFLYNTYLNFRKGVVMNGFAFPRVADLADPTIAHMLNSAVADRFGHTANSLRQANAYPASKFKAPGALESESHLMYPWPMLVNREPDACAGAPDAYFSADPFWYINARRNAFIRDQYVYFRSFAESGIGNPAPAAVEAKYGDLAMRAQKGGLGNAVVLSGAIYNEYVTIQNDCTFADFNLDSDRGYAFKGWRKVTDISLLNDPRSDPADFNVPIETDRKVPNVQDDVLFPDGSQI